MTLKPQPNSGVNGPLWLIAFSLLTIAICMVFLVIEKQVAEPKSSPHADSSIKTPPSPRQERLRLSPAVRPAVPSHLDTWPHHKAQEHLLASLNSLQGQPTAFFQRLRRLSQEVIYLLYLESSANLIFGRL